MRRKSGVYNNIGSSENVIAVNKAKNPLEKWIKDKKNAGMVTKKDVLYIYRNVIFAKTFGELKEIMLDKEKHEKYPVFVVAVIAAVLGDIARGNLMNITKMFSLVFPDAEKRGYFFTDTDISKASFEDLERLEQKLKALEGEDEQLLIEGMEWKG